VYTQAESDSEGSVWVADLDSSTRASQNRGRNARHLVMEVIQVECACSL
jgi:hypothetical protein